MKKIALLVLFSGFYFSAFCQEKKVVISDTCSTVLRDVSYFWQLDSLGTNGFRLYAYEGLLKCRLSRLTLPILLDMLGKPNFVRKANDASYYCYNYYDGRLLPREAGYTREVLFLSFRYDSDKPYLINVATDYDD